LSFFLCLPAAKLCGQLPGQPLVLGQLSAERLGVLASQLAGQLGVQFGPGVKTKNNYIGF
jgi:hypothetical protein